MHFTHKYRIRKALGKFDGEIVTVNETDRTLPFTQNILQLAIERKAVHCQQHFIDTYREVNRPRIH